MKGNEIFGWIMILSGSSGIIKLSAQPIPDHIHYWAVLVASVLAMGQFVWGVSCIKKTTKP